MADFSSPAPSPTSGSSRDPEPVLRTMHDDLMRVRGSQIRMTAPPTPMLKPSEGALPSQENPALPEEAAQEPSSEKTFPEFAQTPPQKPELAFDVSALPPFAPPPSGPPPPPMPPPEAEMKTAPPPLDIPIVGSAGETPARKEPPLEQPWRPPEGAVSPPAAESPWPEETPSVEPLEGEVAPGEKDEFPDRFAAPFPPPTAEAPPEESFPPVRDLAAEIAGEEVSQQPAETLPETDRGEALFPEGETPLKPEELLALEEEVAELPGERRFPIPLPRLPRLPIPTGMPPVALIAGGGVFIVILFLGTYLLFFRGGEPAVEPPPTTPTQPVDIPVAPLPPEPVIPISSSTTIPIDDASAASLELAEFLAGTTTPNTLRAVSLKIEADGTERYLDFEEMTEALGIKVPDDVAASLDPFRFTFFVFGQPGTAKTRAGLAVAVNEVEALRAAMTRWETTMVADFDPLLRKLGKVQGPASSSFKTTIRNNLTNRYQNFPDPTISLDYAIDPENRVLLLSTSQSAQYAAMDLLP